ncbi:MAG TPA: hypothetical protein VFT50_11455 [Baekduia sp.]|nr:hypothetical protein [Baekduia sp.]
MTPEVLSYLDLLALSDLAWGVVDPAAEHEREEQAWTSALPHGWPPRATTDDLRVHLGQVVSSVPLPPPAIPLETVAAVMVFLAEHPERRDLGDALLGDAVRDAFDGDVPAGVARWVALQRRAPGQRRRSHGAAQPRRTGTRPAARDTA